MNQLPQKQLDRLAKSESQKFAPRHTSYEWRGTLRSEFTIHEPTLQKCHPSHSLFSKRFVNPAHHRQTAYCVIPKLEKKRNDVAVFEPPSPEKVDLEHRTSEARPTMVTYFSKSAKPKPFVLKSAIKVHPE